MEKCFISCPHYDLSGKRFSFHLPSSWTLHKLLKITQTCPCPSYKWYNRSLRYVNEKENSWHFLWIILSFTVLIIPMLLCLLSLFSCCTFHLCTRFSLSNNCYIISSMPEVCHMRTACKNVCGKSKNYIGENVLQEFLVFLFTLNFFINTVFASTSMIWCCQEKMQRVICLATLKIQSLIYKIWDSRYQISVWWDKNRLSPVSV